MKTQKHIAIAGILAVFAITLVAFAACDVDVDVSPKHTLTGITLNTTSVKKAYTQNEQLDLSGLVVTATYSDSSRAAVTGYTTNPANGAALSTAGTIPVTVSYTEETVTRTNTFNVTVTAANNDITYTATRADGEDGVTDTTGIVFTFSASVTGLTADDITVTNGTGEVTMGDLSGSGTSWTLGVTVITPGNVTVAIDKTGIEAGTKDITVYKEGQTAPTLTGITAVYTQGATIVYPTTPLDDLKAGLTVTATYSTGTPQPVTSYELSGTLTVGTSTVTVSYTDGDNVTKTTTFDVTVTAKTLTGITLNTTSVKKDYNQNETLNLSGLIVTANYSDGSSAAVSYTSTSPTNGSTLSTAGIITVTVSYTEETVTQSNTFTVTVSAPAHTHQWGEWTVTTAATCSATGVGLRYCTECNEQDSNTTIPINPNAHQLDPNYIITQPTCTTAGSGAVVCLLNDAHSNPTQQVVLPALGHLYGDWTETTAPLCETDGVDTRTCSRDSNHKETRPITALGHDYQNWTQTTAPTCTTEGVETGTCTRDPSHTTTRPGAAIVPDAHDWNTAITTITAATATTDGEEGYVCNLNNSHTKDTSILYATGTAGLSFTLIGDNTAYRVSRGTATGNIFIPTYRRPNASSAYLPVTEIAGNAFQSSTAITGVTIPASVTTIGNNAFRYCTSLTAITIPGSVTSIGDSAFYNCTSLTGIRVDANNQNYASHDGILYNKEKTSFVQIPQGISGNVTIPDSVTSIPSAAFRGCTNLTGLTIPEGITEITYFVFDDCTGLTSLTIPASVTYIYSGVLASCISLTSITIDGNNPNYAAEGGILYNKAKTSLLAYPSASGNATIPSGITSIGASAFSRNTRLTGVTIPAGVTGIGSEAFSYCTGLTGITIPAGVRSIGYRAFFYCTGLTGITIPASVTSIDQQAFQSCTGLTGVTIAEGVTTIGIQAFSDCTGLTNITIPASVTTINNYAFYQCTGLTSVTFNGTIASGSFISATPTPFPGDLRDKFYATDSDNGTPGTYTRPDGTSTTWTRQE